MRLAVRVSEARCHHVAVPDGSTVGDVKHAVSDLEGVPSSMQVLVFAGMMLGDEQRLAEELQLQEYSLQEEVTLHLQRKLAEPVRVYLSSQANRTTRLASLVETGGPLQAVMQLLTQHGLAPAGGGFVTGPACVVVKRGDGTTYTKLLACESDSVGWLLDRLHQLEGQEPGLLTFMQAPDGCMHCLHTRPA